LITRLLGHEAKKIHPRYSNITIHLGGTTPAPFLIADLRERASGIPQALSAKGLEVRMKNLRAGDYILAPQTRTISLFVCLARRRSSSLWVRRKAQRA
jgi:ERCC4-type nuclease